MSSTLTSPRQRESRQMIERVSWSESSRDEEGMVFDLTGNSIKRYESPVTVENEELLIRSSLLEVGKVYQFNYLGSDMVLWKQPNDVIDVYEVLGD
ncbi:hypothetical protein ACFLWM_00430 [Chloroflexota bacterium]